MTTSSGSWFAGGIGSGFLLTWIGTTVITIAADGEKSYLIPENINQKAYVLGYYQQSKRSNKLAALGGGCLGSALGLVLWYNVIK